MSAGRDVGFGVALLISVIALGPPTVRAAPPTLVPLATDGFTNPESIHRTIVEPAAHAWRRTLVATFQVGRIAGGGAADIGWATSTNGGRTWSTGVLPGTTAASSPPGGYSSVSDPAVAYDPRNRVWLIVFLGLVSISPVQSDVLVSRSTDGGLTWSRPVVVDGSGTSGGVTNDKTWIACDDFRRSPFYGRCYAEFTNFTASGRIQVSVSADGGVTWDAPRGTPSNAVGQGGQPLAQPNGTVVVPFVDIGGVAVRSFRSTDGGASWAEPVDVSPLTYHGPAGGLRAPSVTSASAAVDADGVVYLAWADCRLHPGCTANDILLAKSSDGVSWTSPVAVPIAGSEDHFIAGLGVDRRTRRSRARLALTYYAYPAADCDVDTCALNAGFVSSRTAGATWSDPVALSGPMSLLWLPHTSGGYMVGDYVATAVLSARHRAFPLVVAASEPTGALLNEAVYTVARGLPTIGGMRAVVVP